MYIDENVKNEMKDMLDRMQRLEKEANGYYGEEKDTILNNKEKIESVYNDKKEEMLEEYNSVISETIENFKNNVDILKTKFEQEKQVLENEFNKKIEEYNNMLQRLEQEKNNYSSDIEYKESIQNNIDRIETEKEQFQKDEGKKIQDILTQKENEMNTKIEEVKAKIKDKTNQAREELKTIGIEVDEINLDGNQKEEPEEIQEEVQENSDNELEIDTTDQIEKTVETVEKENKEEQRKYQSQSQIIRTNMARQNEHTKKISNEAVRIFYSAKQDKYLVTNLNNKEQKIIKRKELTGLDKEKLAEKMGKDPKDLMNIDDNILEILSQYDKENGTSKLNEYFENTTDLGKNKKERKQQMEDSKIEIEYNLNGLYDKIPGEEYGKMNDLFTLEERMQILNIANNAKSKGIATVKKGIKVAIREALDKIVEKVKTSKLLGENKRLKLPESRREKRKNEQYDKLVNKEYMKSLDEDFERQLKEEKRKQFKEKIRKSRNEKMSTIKESFKIDDLGKAKDYDEER